MRSTFEKEHNLSPIENVFYKMKRLIGLAVTFEGISEEISFIVVFSIMAIII